MLATPAIDEATEPARPAAPVIVDAHRSSQWVTIPFLLIVAFIATLPGWLPRRVYLPQTALDSSSLMLKTVERTTRAAEQIRHGEAPLWNPAPSLGEPLLSQGSLGALGPTILPHLIPKPTWSWTISALMRLVIAGVGLWFLAGRYGLDGAPRLLAAATFMLSALVAVHLHDPMIGVLIWLPWALITIERLVDRITLPRIVVTALIFAAQFLVGDAPSSIAFVLTCAVWLAMNIAVDRPRRALVTLPAILLAALLGLGLSGVQWLPWWEDGGGPSLNRVGGWSIFASAWIGVIPLLLAISAISSARKNPIVLRLTILALTIGAFAPASSWLAHLLPRRFQGNDFASPLLGALSMSLALLAGFGLASWSRTIRWKRGEEMKTFEFPEWSLVGIAIVELLAIVVWFNRGISSAKYDELAAAARRDPGARVSTLLHRDGPMPPIWFARSAEWYDHRADVAQALSSAKIDPTEIVLLDDDVSPDNIKWKDVSPEKRKWIDRLFPNRASGHPAAGVPAARRGRPRELFAPRSPQLSIVEQSANHLRLRTASLANGWIIIPAAYADGWTARDLPIGQRGAMTLESIVLPAYGALRAVAVNETFPAEFLIEYRPLSFRHGLIVTSASAILLALLLACALFAKKRLVIEPSRDLGPPAHLTLCA